jgi:hypothetical protein
VDDWMLVVTDTPVAHGACLTLRQFWRRDGTRRDDGAEAIFRRGKPPRT